MLTIHAADEVRYGWGDDADRVNAGAVAVDGTRVVGLGPLTEVRERFPNARVRHWPGVLGPGRVHEGPLPDAPSPRERVHAVLKSGATAVLEQHTNTPELRSAAERNHVVLLPSLSPTLIVEQGRADLAIFDEADVCMATVCAGRLVHRRR
ncbi:hypothetical protein F9278_29955 [Streptomyces phaeolivaceus]|uniref:Aminodeoxyfutalosine deaminase/Imidazolonepropionase-like composite domain-containing protein n=1 Tax=Streptomyces phaeolivaceus TaxID=2653200 RepID=A0A5P8KA50_9ACTN|nr:hypothetical protein [Streptomyces phaeolivaceus]QFQ99678.1 hypothetical protein F9278_29955 [Streptomyces phaeolivaceus]